MSSNRRLREEKLVNKSGSNKIANIRGFNSIDRRIAKDYVDSKNTYRSTEPTPIVKTSESERQIKQSGSLTSNGFY